MRRRSRSWLVALLLAFALLLLGSMELGGGALAQDPDEAVEASLRAQAAIEEDPFWAAAGDPMELAHQVDRLGDGALLDRLAEGRPLPIRLAAVRATPYLSGPEAALGPLAAAAAGRDPDLAPAAAFAALRIAQDLEPQGLDAREVDRAALAAPTAALEALSEDESARADLRRAAALAAHLLTALGAPEAEAAIAGQGSAAR